MFYFKKNRRSFKKNEEIHLRCVYVSATINLELVPAPIHKQTAFTTECTYKPYLLMPTHLFKSHCMTVSRVIYLLHSYRIFFTFFLFTSFIRFLCSIVSSSATLILCYPFLFQK